MKKIAIALSVCLLAATAFALVGAEGGLGEMTLKRLRGDVTVLRAGDLVEVDDESPIEPGDRITTGTGGRAELRLEGLRQVELAPSATVSVTSTKAVDGLGGSLLASAGGEDKISVGFGRVEGSISTGMFRVDLGAGSSRLGVYKGSASISSPGQSDARIERYFQTSVAGNDQVLEPAPLVLEEGDPWDRIHLSEVLALDERITKLGNGLSTQLGGGRLSVDYFAALVSEPVGFLSSYVRRERTPDLLIGFMIARYAEAPIGPAFIRAFDYRHQDASWGLIARIMSAREGKLVAQLGRTIINTGILAAEIDEGVGLGPGTEGVAPPVAPGAQPPAAPSDSPGDGPGSDPGDGDDDPDPSPSPPPDESECSPEDPAACLDDLPFGDGAGGGDSDEDEGLLD